MKRKGKGRSSRQRAALRKAQLVSARRRKGRPKDTYGYWVARGIRKVASMATMGASSAIAEFMEGAKRSSVKARKRR